MPIVCPVCKGRGRIRSSVRFADRDKLGAVCRYCDGRGEVDSLTDIDPDGAERDAFDPRRVKGDPRRWWAEGDRASAGGFRSGGGRSRALVLAFLATALLIAGGAVVASAL